MPKRRKILKGSIISAAGAVLPVLSSNARKNSHYEGVVYDIRSREVLGDASVAFDEHPSSKRMTGTATLNFDDDQLGNKSRISLPIDSGMTARESLGENSVTETGQGDEKRTYRQRIQEVDRVDDLTTVTNDVSIAGSFDDVIGGRAIGFTAVSRQADIQVADVRASIMEVK